MQMLRLSTAPAPAIHARTCVLRSMYSPAVTTAYTPLKTYPSKMTGTMGRPSQYAATTTATPRTSEGRSTPSRRRLAASAITTNTRPRTKWWAAQARVLGSMISNVSNAAVTLVGQNLGAGHPERAEASAWKICIYNTVCLVSIGAIFLLFAPLIVSAFTGDPVVAAYAIQTAHLYHIWRTTGEQHKASRPYTGAAFTTYWTASESFSAT